MSASREKKKRQDQPEEMEQVEVKKGNSKKTLKRVLAVVIAIVLVAVIVFLGMVSTGFFAKHSTAAVIGDHSLSPATVNYFYANTYNSMKSTLDSMLTPDVPLSEQEYGGEEFATWEDFLLDYAMNGATSVYAIYDEAMENGYTISEAGQAQIDSELQMVEAYAPMYGLGSGDAFLAAQYGQGCNMKNYKEYLTINTLSNEYQAKVQNDLDYTEADWAAYYEENPETFDCISYRAFTISPDMMGVEDKEDALKAAKEEAESIAAEVAGDEAAYLEAAVSVIPEENAEGYDADVATLRENSALATVPETYHDWLADPARKEGDVTFVDNGEAGSVVLYFIETVDNDYPLPNVRHILISASDTSDEAAMAEAKAKAEEVLAKYEAGEKTEEAFAELAKEFSMDNAEEGGLYEEIAPGMMVQAFNDWCFDSARQPGDTGIVETEYGYHVMYFSGYSDTTYKQFNINNVMINEAMQTWYGETTADVDYTLKAAAGKYLPKF